MGLQQKQDLELIYSLHRNWPREDIKVKKIGGQTNRNYLVQYKNKRKFVRLPWEASDIVDRKVEAGNILALAKSKKLAEILPKYYLYFFRGKNILSRTKKKFLLPDGTMVTEYIEGTDIGGRDLEKSKIQKALLKTLYTFHTSGVKFVNRYDVFRDEILKYKKKAKKYPIHKLIRKEKIEEIEEIENRIKGNFSFRRGISTHNDLIFENLRLGKNGRIYLLDFEYAGFNVRDGLFYDLGIILGGNLFQGNPITIKIFEEILENAKKIYQKNLSDYKIYCGALTNILVMFWWGIVKYFSSHTKAEKKYFKNYILKRAKGIQYLYSLIDKKTEIKREGKSLL